MASKDSLDEKIIELMGEDSRQSSQVLARKLNVSSATIRRRLRKLADSGLLHYVAVVDSTKIDQSFTVVFAMDVDRDKVKSVTKTLVAIPEIKWVATTTGRFDILATAYLKSPHRLSDFLEDQIGSIEGIKDTETIICMDVKKGFLIPLGSR